MQELEKISDEYPAHLLLFLEYLYIKKIRNENISYENKKKVIALIDENIDELTKVTFLFLIDEKEEATSKLEKINLLDYQYIKRGLLEIILKENNVKLNF